MATLFDNLGEPLIKGPGHTQDYQVTAGERFAEEWERGLEFNPVAYLGRQARFAVERNAPFFGLPSNMVSKEAAHEELKSRGLEGMITVGDEGISRTEFDMLQYIKQREINQQGMASAPQSFGAHVAGFAGSFAAGAVDPINIASAFIPIVPEARYAAWLAKAGTSFGARAGARATAGAIEGAVGAAMIEPFMYMGAQAEQRDYGVADSMMNIVFGTLLGGGLHTVGGAVYDWRMGRVMRSLDQGLQGLGLRDVASEASDQSQLDALRRFVEAEEAGAPPPDAVRILREGLTPEVKADMEASRTMPDEVPEARRADGQPPSPRGLTDLIDEAKADRTAEVFNRQFIDKEQRGEPLMGDVRAPREDIFEVAQANFVGATKHRAKTVPIEQLTGGVSKDPAETKRVQNLVDLMRGPAGFIERLIVDSRGNVIEGQHRLEALRQMGVKEVPVIEISELRDGLPVEQMADAIRSIRTTRDEHVTQLIDRIAEAVADVGSLAEVRAQYEAPAGFERQWAAALDAAEAADELKAQSDVRSKIADGKFYDDEFDSVEKVLRGFESGQLLVHARAKDGTDFQYGIDPRNGDFLKSTDSYASYVDAIRSEDPDAEPAELTFFSGVESGPVTSWADFFAKNGKQIELVFVRKSGDIQKSLGDGNVMTADGKVMPYDRSPLADYENPAMRDEPGGVEPGDWYTDKTVDVVAVLDVADEATSMKSQSPPVKDASGNPDIRFNRDFVQPDLKAVTETPQFKQWFKKSAVVGKDGEPVIMHHHGSFDEADGIAPEGAMHWGTKNAAIDRSQGKRLDDELAAVQAYEGEDGQWHWEDGTGQTSEDRGLPGYSSADVALSFGRSIVRDQIEETDFDYDDLGRITSAWLSIQNPMRVEDQGADWSAAIQKAKELGHDGIVYTNKFEDKGSTSYITFEPTQVKSVNNTGAFSLDIADIRANRDLDNAPKKFPYQHDAQNRDIGTELMQSMNSSDGAPLAVEVGVPGMRPAREPLVMADGPDAPKVIGTDAAGRPVLDFRDSVVSHFTDEESAADINSNGYRVVGDGYYGEAISFTPNREFGRQFGGVETVARIAPDARILNTGLDADAKIIMSVLNDRRLVPNNPRLGQKTWRQAFLDLGVDGLYDPGAGDLFIYNAAKVWPVAMDGLAGLKTMIGADSMQPSTDKFDRWFDNSKAVDADGQPQVWLHSTTQDFDTFDISKSSPGAAYGPGIYMTLDKGDTDWARGVGHNVMPLFVKMKNPLDTTKPLTETEAAALRSIGMDWVKAGIPTPLVAMERRFGTVGAAAQAAGFDALVHRGPQGQQHLLVFSRNQVKSAIGNGGNYDPDLADIRAQRDFDAAVPRVDDLSASTPSDYRRMLDYFGPEYADAPVIGPKGDILFNAIDQESLGGPAIMVKEDGSVVAGIVAWHGSPHDFDRFDITKIGTGEGAQAYGHGLYFAEARRVGQKYKDMLSDMATALPGLDWKERADWTELQDEAYGLADTALEELQIDITQGGSERPTWQRVVDKVRNLAPAGREKEILRELDVLADKYGWKDYVNNNPGRLYLNFLAVRPEELLDWDRPLSEQPESVRSALMGLANPDNVGSLVSGADAYKSVNRNLIITSKDGRVLHTKLDGASSGSKEDDAMLYLLHKNGNFDAAIAAASNAKADQRAMAPIIETLKKWQAEGARFSNAQSVATEQLKAAGIKGIRFKDGLSRGAATHLQLTYKGKPYGDPIPVAAHNQVSDLVSEYKEKGFGVELKDVGTRNYVIFDDDLIDIIDKFQKDLDEQPDLVAAHNLTSANLLHADKMGGLAAPSLAIAKASDGHEGYGEITLIGSKDLVDPQKGAKVYAGDIYSARYPTVHYNIKYDAIRKLEKKFAATAKEMGVTVRESLDDDALEREGPRALENSVGAMLTYAKEKGISVEGYVFDHDAWEVRNREAQAKERAIRDEWNEKRDAERERAQAEGRDPDETAIDDEFQPKYMEARREAMSILREPDRALDEVKWKLRDKFRGDDQFLEWAADKFAELKAKERIFKGFSDRTGGRMYAPHTLDNVVRLMTKKIRDAEGFNYGIGNLRAKVAPKFKSVEAIQGRKGSLVSRQEFDAIKKEADAELTAVADQLLPKAKYKGNTFGQMDALTQHMAEAIDRGNVKRVLQEYYNGITDDDVRMVGNFLQKLRSMPTTYFEAKLDRAVSIGEFEAAVVPNTITKKAREVLERSGVKQIVEYDPKVEGARQAAIDSIRDLKFQLDNDLRSKGFYSVLERSLQETTIKKASGKDWKGWLANRPGIKADEMEYTGLDDFLTLNQDAMLTKDEVLAHVKDNAVQIVENSFGDRAPPTSVENDPAIRAEYQPEVERLTAERRAMSQKADDLARDVGVFGPFEVRKSSAGGWFIVDRRGEWGVTEYKTKADAEAALGEANDKSVKIRKLNEKSSEITRRIREIQEEIQRRSVEKAKQGKTFTDIGPAKWQQYVIGDGLNYRELVFEWANPPEDLKQRPFAQAHHERDNILAHARVVDRPLPDGGMAVHAEELQSDWHQKGRDFGYRKSLSRKDARRLSEIDAALDKSERELMDLYDTIGVENGYKNILEFEKAEPRKAKAAMDDDPRVKKIFADDNVLIAERDKLRAGPRSKEDVQNEIDRVITQLRNRPGVPYAPSEEHWKQNPDLLERFEKLEAELKTATPSKRSVPDAPFKKNWVELVLKRLIRYAAENGYSELLITPGVVQAERYDLTTAVDSIRAFPLADDIWQIQGIKDGNVIVDGIEVHRDDLAQEIGKKAAKQILENPTRKFKDQGGGATVIADAHELVAPDLRIGGWGMIEFYDEIVVRFLNTFGKKYGAKTGTRSLTLDYEAGGGSKVQQAWDLHSFPITEALREQAMKGMPLFQKDGTEGGGAVPPPGKRVSMAPVIKRSGKFAYEEMSSERAARSEKLREQVEALIDKYTGGRVGKRWVSSMRVKQGDQMMKVDGGFSARGQLIVMALDAADMAGSVKHEAIHALKELGILTDREWDILVRTALDNGWLDKKYGNSKNTIRERYWDLPLIDQIEEAIAEEFRIGRWDSFQGYPEAIRPALLKVREFFDRLAEIVRKIFGKEATAQDIFNAIERGEVGARQDVGGPVGEGPLTRGVPEDVRRSQDEAPPTPFDRWAADDAAIAAQAQQESQQADETLQDIEAELALSSAHIESMRQRGLLSVMDEEALRESDQMAKMMEEQAAAYEAAGICEGEA